VTEGAYGFILSWNYWYISGSKQIFISKFFLFYFYALVQKNCYLIFNWNFLKLNLRRSFSKQNLTNTSSICPIFELKNLIGNFYFDKLTCEGLLLVKKKVFPTQDFIFRVKLEYKITNFLRILAQLSDSNNINIALNLIEKFIFNFCIRVYIINLFKKQKLKDPFIKNLKLTTYEEALYFLNITQLKNLQKPTFFKILYCKRQKKKESINHTRLSSILDRILQKQFKLLLDPIIDVKLYKFQFGYRKSKSALQFIGKLHMYVTKVLTKSINVLKIDIDKCFDSFLHKKILEIFP